MSEIDRLKEEIGWLKVVFALLVAIGCIFDRLGGAKLSKGIHCSSVIRSDHGCFGYMGYNFS
ncbi:MAG: hypothetical protein O7D86_09420 [Proteobacteria bacterium]|nr:hypothetical protein [Pseudomonadota bacterium]